MTLKARLDGKSLKDASRLFRDFFNGTETQDGVLGKNGYGRHGMMGALCAELTALVNCVADKQTDQRSSSFGPSVKRTAMCKLCKSQADLVLQHDLISLTAGHGAADAEIYRSCLSALDAAKTRLHGSIPCSCSWDALKTTESGPKSGQVVAYAIPCSSTNTDVCRSPFFNTYFCPTLDCSLFT